MKKICLIIPDLYKGGMERVMSVLANYFSTKVGTEVHVVLLTKSVKFYTVNSNVIIHEPDFNFENKIRILSIIRTIYFLRRTIRQMRPDSILSFGETYNSFVLLSCLFLNFRIFISDRSRPDKPWGFFHENLRRLIYPLAQGIISQTNFSRDFLLKETGHKNIVVIPNPVRINRNDNSDKDSKVILNIGRLIKSKRIDLLLTIFSRCENDNWELWIVGEGDQKKALSELAIKLNIAHKVVFWDKQEDTEMFYSKANIFAFTSESEGLPNALLEAMVSGLACISFDCIAGPRDIIINGENGYLIKMNDLDDYTLKLNILIKDQKVREKFSLNSKKLSEVYNIRNIGEKFYNFLLS